MTTRPPDVFLVFALFYNNNNVLLPVCEKIARISVLLEEDQVTLHPHNLMLSLSSEEQGAVIILVKFGILA